MINNLLALIQQEDSLSLGEACIYALMGFCIVFVGIVVIIFVIWLIGLLMRKTDNLAFLSKIGRKKKKAAKPEEITTVAEEVQSDEVPDEIKAAIVAALMAYYTKEQPKCEFKVKRIKRI